MVNLRIVLWIAAILLAVVLIGPNLDPQGVRITSIQPDSPVSNLETGDVILSIEGRPATPEVLEQPYQGTIRVETSSGTRFFRVNGTLGIGYEDVPSTNLKFGLDIRGGVRAIVSLEEDDPDTLQNTIDTLENRINFFGLREASFRPIQSPEGNFIEISMAGGNREELKELLETAGRFEAKIPVLLNHQDGRAQIELDRTHEITVLEDSIATNGETVTVGESLELGGVNFTLSGIDERTVNLTPRVFTGNDIITVFIDPQRSRVETVEDGFQWSFAVEITNEGAGRFSKVTQNLGIVGRSLSSPINLYLDGELIDSLSISSSLKGQVVREVSISGFAPTMDQAVEERARLQSILRSGELPTSIEIQRFESISPTLGSDFVKNAALAGLGGILGVLVIALIRYRRVKIVIPMIVVSLSEVLIILGAASAIGWTIDLAAIAGIIAAVGTGIDSQIMILDESIRGDVSIKEKLRRAFFIIFGAGGTTIAAMIPLWGTGAGLLRGFATITIIGVLVGILITRPAFGKMVERIVGQSTGRG